jgi:hypothetical protein
MALYISGSLYTRTLRKTDNMKNNQKYHYNTDVFYNEDDISYYLLGAFITDGTIGQSGFYSILTSVDVDWLEIIAKIISPTLLPQSNNNKVKRLKISNKEITTWFQSHGCLPAKSLTVKLPQIPDEYFRDFLRGCIDGDGCITYGNYKTVSKYGKEYYYPTHNCYLCSSSFVFLEKITEKLVALGLKASLSEIKKVKSILDGREIIPKNPHYRISFGGQTCYDLLNYAYYPGHKLAMPRKNLLAQEIIAFYEEKISNAELNKKKTNNCIDCGIELTDARSKRCVSCNGKTHYKIVWPSSEELNTLIDQIGKSKLAKQLGVSYQSLTKHITKHSND